jgi:hypothetical protein
LTSTTASARQPEAAAAEVVAVAVAAGRLQTPASMVAWAARRRPSME